MVIYSNNQGAITLAKNPQYHARTKHIAALNYWIWEQLVDDKIVLEYVPTEEQIANGLIKPLLKDWFIIFHKVLGFE